MSRTLLVSLVEIKQVHSNKNIPMMNFIGEEGRILRVSDIPELEAIKRSLGHSDNVSDFDAVIKLLRDYEQLSFTIEY